MFNESRGNPVLDVCRLEVLFKGIIEEKQPQFVSNSGYLSLVSPPKCIVSAG